MTTPETILKSKIEQYESETDKQAIIDDNYSKEFIEWLFKSDYKPNLKIHVNGTREEFKGKIIHMIPKFTDILMDETYRMIFGIAGFHRHRKISKENRCIIQRENGKYSLVNERWIVGVIRK